MSSGENELGMAYMSDEEWEEMIAEGHITPAPHSEVDDILERWLAGEDVSEWEDDGTIAEIKEDADELE